MVSFTPWASLLFSGVISILARICPSAPRTVILSYATWQKRFGGRKDVTGETVTLSGIPYAIVGVLPQDFQFAPRGNAEFWTTLHASDQCVLRRSCHNLNGIGRLKDGVSVGDGARRA